MKKTATRLLVLLVILALMTTLAGCSQESEPTPTPRPTATIPYETLTEIDDAITKKLGGRDDISVYVSEDYNDHTKLEISISAEGMQSKAMFSDYVHGAVEMAKEIKETFSLDTGSFSVLFTRGEDELLSWRSNDGVKGTFMDSYGGNKILKTDTDIEYLVAEYGAMGWFYPGWCDGMENGGD